MPQFFLRFILPVFFIAGSASAAIGEIPVLRNEGNGVYTIHAANLEGVLGLMLEVTFDNEALALETVDRGADIPAGTTWSKKVDNNAGIARIVIANATTPLKAGSLGRLFFKVLRPKNIPMPTLRADITSSHHVDPPPSPSPQAPAASAGGANFSAAGALAEAVQEGNPDPQPDEGGEDVAPDEPLQPEPEPEPDFEPPPPVPVPPAPSRPAEPQRPAQPAPPAVPGAAGSVPRVLERFRTFTGERTMENFLGLFTAASPQGLKQEPPVAIADGTSSVVVTLRLQGKETMTPTFALHGARLVALDQSEDEGWILQVVPAEGKLYAIVSVLTDSGVMDFPLTVAPPVPAAVLKDVSLTEQGFRHFLKETGAQGQVRYDVNGDGRRDYVDDYIFTANFLASRAKSPAKEPSPR